MFSAVQRVLVLAPHTDDGELGAGATIARLIEEGAAVHYAAFSIAEESVPAGFARDVLASEVLDATAALGIARVDVTTFRYPVRKFPASRQEILEDIIKLRAALDPELVFAPASTDVHQDHRVISEEALRAFKNRRLLGYELIWNNVQFHGQMSVRVERRHVERKQQALACYRSQAGRAYVSPEFIEGHARTRGVQSGLEFAECFEVMRWVTD
jgi:N-acetylglucosamine malate deacetylase 1